MSTTLVDASLGPLRADVAAASRVVAPLWPLTSFVAVNPLGDFENLPFEVACEQARRRLGARTHLSLAEYRAARRRGEITDADLRLAIAATDPLLAAEGRVAVGRRDVDVVELVLGDLVDGPEHQRTDMDDPVAVEIAAHVAGWCAVFVDDHGSGMAMPDREDGFYAAWHRCAPDDRRLRRLVGRSAQAWIAALPDDPASALDIALRALGVDAGGRVEALGELATRLPGWAGHARWRDEWDVDDGSGPRLTLIDLLAVLAVIEASIGSDERRLGSLRPDPLAGDATTLDDRVAAALARHGAAPDDDGAREAVTRVLARVPEPARRAVWLAAREIHVRDGLLGAIGDPPDESPSAPPLAHVVTCIDVRSEVLRRHLEQTGDYDTYGFAGFFGVPVRWRPAGSPTTEPRCPVLVTPRFEVAEHAEGPGRSVGRDLLGRGARSAYHDAKLDLGAPFALAEAAGWLLGPLAAFRTLLPGRAAVGPVADAASPTGVAVDPSQRPGSGLPLDDRVLFAEAILTTIGLDPTAPLLVLCGHGSRTVNNPHASALECGACGGAPGGASARVAAAILNDPEVRDRLRRRDVRIGDQTWVVAAEHDTTADTVTILDRHLVPPAFHGDLARLDADLTRAGAAAARERAGRLPGDPRRVRHRGHDWAQVRPEWGLAGNTAFVAGRRSLTRDLDLGGRVFLHSYDAATDPDGVALETILTAPLVVAQWISCQYYFSAVDPDVFGAGDKMVHNPIGGVGVVRGDGGDLAVGLPLQSVSDGARLAHDPVRLQAIVEAPIELVEQIVARNPGLRHLVEHGWITIAARDDAGPWSLRSRAGTWTTWHPADRTDMAHAAPNREES